MARISKSVIAIDGHILVLEANIPEGNGGIDVSAIHLAIFGSREKKGSATMSILSFQRQISQKEISALMFNTYSAVI